MVSANFHPYVGGAEKQALELSRALRAAGVDVVVLTRKVGGSKRVETLDGVEIRRLPAWGWGFVDSIVFMLSCFAWLLLHPRRFAAVHAHLAASPALAAALAARLLGKRAVVKVGGGRGIGELASSETTWAGRLKLRALAALGPQFVAVNRELVAELAEHGLGRAPVLVQPNGVDTARYRPAAAGEQAALRRELGWPPGLGFLYVGRLAAEKRLDFFIEQLAAALRGRPAPAFAAFVGAGDAEPLLREVAAATGLTQRVLFLPPASDVARLYRAADVFVLPSISEGLSNALLEAMASGLPALASRVGGTPDAVRDGASGFLFDPEDADTLRERIGRFLENPELARRMGAQAREDARARFDLAAVASRYRELYGLEPSR